MSAKLPTGMAVADSGVMRVMSPDRGVGWIVLSLASIGCSASLQEERAGQPLGWDDEIRLPVARDLNPDPHVLELDLEARESDIELIPGQLTRAWTYDGGIPGPLIRANVGDRLIVHFTNSLPEPTTIHWHGLRVPNDQDGVPESSQSEVPPGGTFDYDFVLPDAGTYWYHPHFDSAEQVGNGLYGPLIVDDPLEPEGLGDEAIIVLSDIAINADGGLEPGDAGGALGTLFGREGDLHLVNGKPTPTLHVRSGLRQRWRIINAAKTRYEQLVLPGHSFTRIGGDDGLLESPELLERIVLTPAQRADIVFEPSTRGLAPGQQALALTWVPYDRGWGTTYNRPDEPVLTFDFGDGSQAKSAAMPALHREIMPIDTTGAAAVDINLTLDPEADGQLAMGINGVPAWQASHLKTSLGERQIWTVKNTFEWDHPFHLHGFFFQVLDVNGVAPTVREWRDTVNVPVDATVRFAVHFDERPGMWMFHCHILDHADAGMMGMVHLQ